MARPRAAPYGWPVEPFDRQHPGPGYFSDPRSPRIERIVLSRGRREIDPEQIKGAVDLVVEAFDRPAMRVPDPKWRDMPVAPALIRWRIVRFGKAVVPWTNAVDFRSTLLPDNQFTRIYAPGSRQNHPKKPGLYRFFLARAWKSGDHPSGEYRLDVEASDIERNKAT